MNLQFRFPTILVVWLERFTEDFIGGQTNEPRLGDHFDDFRYKIILLENSRIMALSLLGADIWRTFERIPCASCQKSYKYRAAETRMNLFGVLSAVLAGELID
ncbi:hypothetical protein AVEN_258123-1 [Araneus ventricosus]|uniref:Uncharacterized protein n=1 Tax=Araneus ventricosus TaxID=182803 RepID=A0A4Y2PPA9_ARAVE|nr:hypothetical protein AVEN_164960-1 [Araneus ventricosus]GBN52447.1 hypothetical protein AVEN_258123-1 [Araneus ventricosus]